MTNLALIAAVLAGKDLQYKNRNTVMPWSNVLPKASESDAAKERVITLVLEGNYEFRVKSNAPKEIFINTYHESGTLFTAYLSAENAKRSSVPDSTGFARYVLAEEYPKDV